MNSVPRPLGLLLILLTALVSLAAAGTARATVADDLCAPTDDPCVISGANVLVDDLSVLDFCGSACGGDPLVSPRAVILQTQLRAGEGTMTLLAGSFTVGTSGTLRARGDIGGNITVITSGAIVVEDNGALQGSVQLRGTTEGGQLIVTAGGSITGAGDINVGSGATGGRAELTAASIVLTGKLDAAGGSLDEGGAFVIEATSGPVHLAEVDVSGGDAGELLVTSAGAATLGGVKARATGDSGTGTFRDTFFVHSGGPIVIEGEIDGQGGSDGLGGELELIAGCVGPGRNCDLALPILPLPDLGLPLPIADQDVTVSAPILLNSRGDFGLDGVLAVLGGDVELADLIDVSGGSGGVGSFGEAGEVFAHAMDWLSLTATGNIKARAGTFGTAGYATLISDGSLALLGPIEADAGESGGVIQLSAASALDIAALIDVGGDDIDAGELTAQAGGPLTVSADLLATSNNSEGGSVGLDGCVVTVEPGVVVDTEGVFCLPGGADPACAILITAHGSMSLAGDFTAGVGGLIELAYRDATRPPEISAALFDVTPSEILDPTLLVCDSDEDGSDDDLDNCAGVPNELQLDADFDGVGDLCDNCITVANGPLLPDAGGNVQLDTDGDGYGGVCDCDFNNDGVCNIGDFNLFLGDFVASEDSGIGSDMNGTAGSVDIQDYNLFLGGFVTGFPGPSAFAP